MAEELETFRVLMPINGPSDIAVPPENLAFAVTKYAVENGIDPDNCAFVGVKTIRDDVSGQIYRAIYMTQMSVIPCPLCAGMGHIKKEES